MKLDLNFKSGKRGFISGIHCLVLKRAKAMENINAPVTN